jgi:deazaflavin-dependent oxidoreductase (nitroreductase family)
MAQADFAKALGDREEISITVTGRRTGRKVRFPVWFVVDGETMWLLPLHGSRTQWYRNVLADPVITVSAGRQQLTARAKVRQGKQTVQRTVDQFRKKYTAALVARYYDHSDAVVEVPLRSDVPRGDQRPARRKRTGGAPRTRRMAARSASRRTTRNVRAAAPKRSRRRGA